MKNRTKGFTLIELMVVIAIIGILSAVVLATLNTARVNARDARRISDIGQIQLALQLYYDGNSQQYPANIAALVPTYLPQAPKDPLTNNGYVYVGLAGTSAATCGHYHVGAVLENSGNSALSSAAHVTAGTVCSASTLTADFNGNTTNCNGSAATSPVACYDQAN